MDNIENNTYFQMGCEPCYRTLSSLAQLDA
jgi:hypothetical protein